MEVKIRNVNAVTLNKIDKLAKEKGMSRQVYLNEQLEVIAEINPIKESHKEVSEVLMNVVKDLNKNYQRLDSIEKKYEELVHFISFTTGIDIRFIEDAIAINRG